MRCSSVPRCPWDKLRTIVVKNSYDSDNSDDYFFARVTNSKSSCTTELDSNSNDFNSGNLDTFTGSDLDNPSDYHQTGWITGNCQNFNITVLKDFAIAKWKYEAPFTASNNEKWRSDYILLKSDRVKYKCTNREWMDDYHTNSMALGDGWVGFNCRRY